MIVTETGFANHVVQYPDDYSLCLGCATCELVCGLARDGLAGRKRGGIVLERGEYKSLRHKLWACQQCEDHPCYDACPLQDEAMCIDENGIVYVDEDACIGCGLCAKACTYEPSRINIVDKKARKCDMCRGRSDEPLCIKYCPALCLGQSDDPLPYEIDAEGEVVA